jgi:tetratricopeptide (TPR) repeat protein
MFITVFKRICLSGVFLAAQSLCGEDIVKASAASPNRATKFEPMIEKYQDNSSSGICFYGFRRAGARKAIDALTELNQQIAQNPQDDFLYQQRALLKNDELNDFTGALADWNKIIQLHPQHFLAYHRRALLKQEKFQDFAGAIIDFDRALEIQPFHPATRSYRAILKATKLNDPQGALADFDMLLSLPPQRPWSNFYARESSANSSDQLATLASKVCRIELDYRQIYRNRAFLKRSQLQDLPGALADDELANAKDR